MSEPNLCDCGRHLPCRHCDSKLCENCNLEPATIRGTHAEAGPIKVCKTCAYGQYWPQGWKEMPVERAETPVEQRQNVSEGGDSDPGIEAARSEIQGLYDAAMKRHLEYEEKYYIAEQDENSTDAELAEISDISLSSAATAAALKAMIQAK